MEYLVLNVILRLQIFMENLKNIFIEKAIQLC